VRQRKAGGDDADSTTRIANCALLDVSRAVDDLKPTQESTTVTAKAAPMAEALLQLAVTYRKVIMPLA
jgi:hypothetical protein